MDKMGYEQLEFDDFEVIGELPGGAELLDEPMFVIPSELAFGVLERDTRPAGVTPTPEVHPSDLPTEQKVERAILTLMGLMREGHPIQGGYSGGKDSSVMAALIVESALRLKEAGEHIPPILFTHARTGIDNPAMDMVAQMEMERIKQYAKKHDLPVSIDVVEPYLNDSWAVRIISGRALPTFANSSSRDCAVSWKVIPQARQRKRVSKSLSKYGEPIVCVGTRYDESTARNEKMTARNESDSEPWEQEVRGKDGVLKKVELRLSPICWWTQEDIWVFLSELSSGERTSYTDAKDLWDVYRDGGNSSCVVVADDTMKANSKACGARFGCALCTAVGRDKSLEAMLESDKKYEYLVHLNRLQRFLVDSQYDLDRRLWLGRSISKDGYVAIGPDAYSPDMQRELLSYALTIDRLEKIAAAKLGIKPRFELVSNRQLIAIDAIWSIQGYHQRPFEAIHIWESVYVEGKSFFPPEIDNTGSPKKMPAPKWLYVGCNWDDDPGFDNMYSGARNLMADFTGATEMHGCMPNIELNDGRIVMATEMSSMFDIDEEGADLFLAYEILDRGVHHEKEQYGSSEAFRYYQMLGTLSTGKKHLGKIDDMLRRSAWKERHGLFEMSRDELLQRSVTDQQRKQGLRCPEGQSTFQEEFAENLAEQHAARTQERAA